MNTLIKYCQLFQIVKYFNEKGILTANGILFWKNDIKLKPNVN